MSVQSEIERIKGNVAGAYSAVAEKGGAVPQQQNSDSLPGAIRSIPSGSVPTTPLDPMEVYKATRPSDWLPMPEPQDNEMYLLFHIPEGVSSLLAFTVACTGSYTVALGTISNGQFVQQSAASVATGGKYEAELFADDYGDLTADGFKQVMVKVSGTDILTWEPSTHTKKTSPAKFSNWNLVEIACKLPQGTRVRCGYGTGSNPSEACLQKLRYFLWYGENRLVDTSYMFSACYGLVSVLQLDTSKVTAASGMFFGCFALMAVPKLNTSAVTFADGIFNKCDCLTAIPPIDTKNVTNMTAAFGFCYALTRLPKLDTSKVENVSAMLNNCFNLQEITDFDIRSITRSTNLFNLCYSLQRLTFAPVSGSISGCDISVKDCSLGHTALVEMFDSLPAITTSHALILTGNPGAVELTAAEKSIATGKGWTLTL